METKDYKDATKGDTEDSTEKNPNPQSIFGLNNSITTIS